MASRSSAETDADDDESVRGDADALATARRFAEPLALSLPDSSASLLERAPPPPLPPRKNPRSTRCGGAGAVKTRFLAPRAFCGVRGDRKSTRLNSSHSGE